MLVHCSFTHQRGPLQNSVGEKHCAWEYYKEPYSTKMKMNTYTDFVLGYLKKICILAHVMVVVYFTNYESLILYKNTLKGL